MAHSPAPDQGTDTTRNALYRRITLRLIPFIFICYLFNYLDRINVGFAKLQSRYRACLAGRSPVGSSNTSPPASTAWPAGNGCS